MAIAGEGLKFYPLHWIIHDQWKWYRPRNNGAEVYDHIGHVHFWMMGFTGEQSGNAFTGQQTHQFELVDQWGPKSGDKNQSNSYRVVGTPRWYFHITELWRRVYIQVWDNGNGQGIKYDASPKDKTFGPYREGQGFAPVWLPYSRTVPVDHYKNGVVDQTSRQNHVADMAMSYLGNDYDDNVYNLQHGTFLHEDHPAAVPPFSDALYIHPTLEYQKVVQLDWERLHGSEQNDVDEENFGDGWSIQTQTPFLVNGEYHSPFADQDGVLPAGQYSGARINGAPLVPEGQRLKNRAETGNDANNDLGMPSDRSGQDVTFHNPYGQAADGVWVQQCLGAIVKAKAKVTLEHKLGGRSDVWTHTIKSYAQAPFDGSDNMQGAAL